jgi:hypothetical protein
VELVSSTQATRPAGAALAEPNLRNKAKPILTSKVPEQTVKLGSLLLMKPLTGTGEQ